MSVSERYCPKAREDEILAHDVGNEVVIYYLRADNAFCLNRLAATVWKNCDGQTPISKLVELLGEFDVPADPAAVQCILDQLAESGLIENHKIKVNRITRRDVLARLGVSAAAIVAGVSAMKVPSAIAAVSGATGGK
jgi:hypothetical protein